MRTAVYSRLHRGLNSQTPIAMQPWFDAVLLLAFACLCALSEVCVVCRPHPMPHPQFERSDSD